MSTAFDIVCLDCCVASNIDGYRVEGVLVDLLKSRDLLVKLCKEIECTDLIVCYAYKVSLEFFVEHEGHSLAVRSEYESFAEVAARVRAGLLWRGLAE